MRLTDLALGYWPARAFSTAAELGIFDALAAGPHTAAELRDQLGLRSPQVVDLLDALAALGVLRSKGDRYALAEPPPPELLDLAGGYAAWVDLPAALRDGATAGPSMFDALEGEELGRFVTAMADAAAPGHAGLVEHLALDGTERVLDVGGADGALALRLRERHPEVRCTVLDRPALAPLARGVEFLAADMFVDPWPPADVVVLSLVLLDWDSERKQVLLAKAHDALAPGGRLVVLDRLDEARPEGAIALLRSLHLLVTVGPAFPFDADELTAWATAAGFGVPDVEPVAGRFSLAVARKVT